DRGSLLRANCLYRRLAHADDFVGVTDAHAPIIETDLVDFGFDERFVADQHQLFDETEFREGFARSEDHALGGVVATHGIYRYSHVIIYLRSLSYPLRFGPPLRLLTGLLQERKVGNKQSHPQRVAFKWVHGSMN